MSNPVDLEPQAKAVVDANADPPFLFELGPDQGRRLTDRLLERDQRRMAARG
jgi:hypothetical protein